MFRRRGEIEFKYRAVDAQAAPVPPPLPPSCYTYFTEQTMRAGYMVVDDGRIHENIQRPLLVREAIERELEKERIREEIIVSQITRRRMLEAEVRREMMLERELALLERGCNQFDRFSFLPGVGERIEPRDLSFERVEQWSLEERIAMPKIVAGDEIIPLEPRAADPKIAEVTLIPEISKEKKKIVILAKPEGNLSGGKQKLLPPTEEDTIEFPLIGVSNKKVKEEWSCAMCMVKATSERGLNEHVRGKKHKAKEAALRAKRNGKNVGIGIRPKKTAKLPILGAATNNSSSELVEKNEVLVADNQNHLAKNKKKFKFWCEMCCVGAFSGAIMEAHRTGKKHKMRMQEATKNGTFPTPHMDSNRDQK